MRGILEIPSVAFKLCSRHTAAHTTHSLCCFYISKHDMLTMFKAILPVKPCFLQHWCRMTEEEMLKLPDPAAEAAAVWFSGRDFRRADGQKVSRWNAGKLCVDVGAGVILPLARRFHGHLWLITRLVVVWSSQQTGLIELHAVRKIN